MKIKNSGKLAFAAVLMMMVIGFSSCNRGYGCPYELKSVVKIMLPACK